MTGRSIRRLAFGREVGQGGANRARRNWREEWSQVVSRRRELWSRRGSENGGRLVRGIGSILLLRE